MKVMGEAAQLETRHLAGEHDCYLSFSKAAAPSSDSFENDSSSPALCDPSAESKMSIDGPQDFVAPETFVPFEYEGE